MSKISLIPILFLTISLTACGQKGALYLPEKHTSEMPTQADIVSNPNDLTNVQTPTQTSSAINPNSQNPNIKLQDSQHDY